MNGDMFMKKLISLLMAISLLVCSLNSWGLVASAAKKVTTTIKNFSASTNLNAEQYGAIREGSYTAVKKSDGWYYKFVRNNQEVFVKATAFSSSCGNDFSKVNSALTSGVMRKDTVPTSYAIAHKVRTSASKGRYVTKISWLDFCSMRDGKNIELECIKKSHVEFTYSSKITIYNRTLNKKTVLCKASDPGAKAVTKAPSNAGEYKLALSRNTSYNCCKVTPTLSIEITNPGKNCVYLSSARYEGRGLKANANTKIELTDLVDIAYTTGKVVAGAVASKTLAFSSLYSLGQKGIKLAQKYSSKEKNKSIDFIDTARINLSNDNKRNGKVFHSLKADFESPLKLQNYNDLFRVKVALTNNISTSGTKTSLKVSVKNIKEN